MRAVHLGAVQLPERLRDRFRRRLPDLVPIEVTTAGWMLRRWVRTWISNRAWLFRVLAVDPRDDGGHLARLGEIGAHEERNA